MGLEKPDERAYDLLLKTMDLRGEDIVFIDDKPENIASAKKKGIDAIVFKSEEQVRQELANRGLLNKLP
jgi:HAD superfamily hydrolase (TIGR01509 family)